MLKKIFNSTLIITLLSVQAYCCTFTPETFCKSIEIYSENLIVSGKIIAKDSDGIDLEVIEVLRGNESKSIIRIWDGTDFDCNGIWNMSCETIGELNDEIIISLPQIVEKENAWDVIGDYRRPNPYTHITELKVSDGKVYGLIKGDASSPDEHNLLEIEYNIFQSAIIDKGDCQLLSSTIDNDELFKQISITNPFNSEIYITNVNPKEILEVNLYTVLGERVFNKSINDVSELRFDIFDQSSNLYFLEIVFESGIRRSFPTIRQ